MRVCMCLAGKCSLRSRQCNNDEGTGDLCESREPNSGGSSVDQELVVTCLVSLVVE